MTMARGWESKAVEGQMEEAAQAVASAASVTGSGPQTFEHKHQLTRLRMIHSQLTAQLKGARTVEQRQALHQSLREIEAQLAALEPPNPT